jgi:hypothetical protein
MLPSIESSSRNQDLVNEQHSKEPERLTMPLTQLARHAHIHHLSIDDIRITQSESSWTGHTDVVPKGLYTDTSKSP